jgi:hypothetical protein
MTTRRRFSAILQSAGSRQGPILEVVFFLTKYVSKTEIFRKLPASESHSLGLTCSLGSTSMATMLPTRVDPQSRRRTSSTDSYTEVSPLGAGDTLSFKMSSPGGWNRHDGVECLVRSRYFTVTDEHVQDTSETTEERSGSLVVTTMGTWPLGQPTRRLTRTDRGKLLQRYASPSEGHAACERGATRGLLGRSRLRGSTPIQGRHGAVLLTRVLD